MVTLTLADIGVQYMVLMGLHLGKVWTSYKTKMKKARVPEFWQKMQSKLEIALIEVQHLIDLGVEFGIVLVDAGYGNSSEFHQRLLEMVL